LAQNVDVRNENFIDFEARKYIFEAVEIRFDMITEEALVADDDSFAGCNLFQQKLET
jgi:hypothetical protein